MKELYFSPTMLKQKSQEMLEIVSDQRANHELDFDLERSALLVLDMQDYFLKQSSHAYIPSALAIIPNIQTLIRAFKERNRPVIYTRHINTEKNAGMMLRWWKDLIRQDSLICEINSALETSNCEILDKHQYDAFYETNLDELLRMNNIAQVSITGVMTHLCCETTARSAFMRGYEVFFVIDGTATYNEAFHRATLINLAHGFVIPVLTKELIIKCA